MPEEYLTVLEVAKLLKLNPQTVRNWIDDGQLPAFRVVDGFESANPTSTP